MSGRRRGGKGGVERTEETSARLSRSALLEQEEMRECPGAPGGTATAAGSSLTRAVMVPCFSPLLLIMRTPAAWNMLFIWLGVAVVAKSTSCGVTPLSRSRTAPPAMRSSWFSLTNSSGAREDSVTTTRRHEAPRSGRDGGGHRTERLHATIGRTTDTKRRAWRDVQCSFADPR